MIACALLTTAALVGAAKLARHRRWAYGCHGYGHHRGGWGTWGYGDHGGRTPPWSDGGAPTGGDPNDEPPIGFRRGRLARRFVIDTVLDHVDASPAQERAIYAAADRLQSEWRAQRDELAKSRGDVAQILRKPVFDEVLLGELYARHDRIIEAGRRSFVGFMATIHEALDDKQRGRLADLVDRRGGLAGLFARGFGPWRRGW